MRGVKSIAALFLLFSGSAFAAGRPALPPAFSLGWAVPVAVPVPVAKACAQVACGYVPFAQLYAPLLIPRIIATSIIGGGSGSVPDPIVPADGTQNITGALAVTGGSDVTQFKLLCNATQTTHCFEVFASDGTTSRLFLNGTKWTFGAAADFNGQVDTSSVVTATAFDDHATATVTLTPLAATGWTGNVPAGKGYFLNANSVTQFSITPTAAGATTATGQVSAAHWVDGSGTPTGVTSGTGCGTPSAATITGGHDGSGQIGITCGTAGSAGNNFVTATFAVPYVTSAPVCVISCANAATCAGEVLGDHMPNPTTTNIAVSCAGGSCTTGTLLWNYVCHGI